MYNPGRNDRRSCAHHLDRIVQMSSFAGFCILAASLLAAAIPVESHPDTHQEGQSQAVFEKTITLPENAEVENMVMSHKKGKLTISIPQKA